MTPSDLRDGVAVVVPVLDRVSTIRDAIDSAIASDPAEIVVVDCGSSDGTLEAVLAYGERVRLLRCDVASPAVARNRGAASIEASSIAFLDSDDVMLSSRVAMSSRLDAEPDVVLVHGATEVIDGRGRPLEDETVEHRRSFEQARRTGTAYGALLGFCSMYTSATLIRRTAFEAIRGYDERLASHEDWDLYLRLSRVGRLVYVDEPVARYRRWEGNVPIQRDAIGARQVARKHLGSLEGAIAPGDRARLAATLQRRIAVTSATLNDRPAARRAALAAIVASPRTLAADPRPARILIASVLPRSYVAVRRARRGRSGSEAAPWPERIDPTHEPPGVVAYHLAKYEFARAHVRGRVLDVACGVGYGTAHLATTADLVIGLEIDGDAVATAGARYASARVRFVRSDAQRLPFSDDSFDAITCFEGIEHLHDPEAHLREVVRALEPKGVYIVSTPHPDAHPHGEDNPYHLHDFPPEEFRALLDARFGDVLLLGQRRLQSSAHRTAQRFDVLGLRRSRVMRPLAKAISRTALGTTPIDDATLDDFVIGPFEGSASEYVAVCRAPLDVGT